MASVKISGLPPASSAALTDLLEASQGPAGSRVSRSVTVQQILALLGLPPLAGLCQGRLTLVDGDPAPTTDQIGKSTVYFTPYRGNLVGLYTGSAWGLVPFTQRSLALSGLTTGKLYDLFGYLSAGTLALELGSAWTDDLTRAVALAYQDGIEVKGGDPTRRFLGTCKATSATTIEDSLANRLLWNHHNRLWRPAFKSNGTAHTYNSVTPRYWRDDSTQKVTFVLGLPDAVWVTFGFQGDNNSTTGAPFCGWGLDTTAIQNGQTFWLNGGFLFTRDDAPNVLYPQLGYHELRAVEQTLTGTAIVNFAFYELAAAILG